MHPGILSSLPQINLTIAANTNDYVIRTAAGSPSHAVAVVLTINSGVIFGSSATLRSIDTGAGWIAGSTITIVNNGDGQGAGGDGDGGNGHPAIYLQWPVAIDNTNGYIRGGGGGGGEGGCITSGNIGGGGGGGGQGHPGGAAGAKPSGYFYSGANGSAGSSSGPGNGGVGGTFGGGTGGTGGQGGAWGKNGKSGGNSNIGGSPGPTGGGNAGNAVQLNGYTVTWLGGFNSTQVLGAVS